MSYFKYNLKNLSIMSAQTRIVAAIVVYLLLEDGEQK